MALTTLHRVALATSLTALVSLGSGPVFGQQAPGALGLEKIRVSIAGTSNVQTDRAMSNTLYGRDRAGSRSYYVLENTVATETAQKDSGLINRGFKNEVDAMQVNPFVKFRGLEVFGVIERAEGRARHSC